MAKKNNIAGNYQKKIVGFCGVLWGYVGLCWVLWGLWGFVGFGGFFEKCLINLFKIPN